MAIEREDRVAANTRGGVVLMVVALLFALGYVVPLFAPPPPHRLLWPFPDAAFGERVFPGVPGWWVGARLFCLLVAAVLGGIALRRSAPPSLEDADAVASRQRASIPPWRLNVVLAFSGLLALTSDAAVDWPPWAQLFYLAALALPAIIVWRLQPASAAVGAVTSAARRRMALAVVLIALTWFAGRWLAALEDPRMANLVDGVTGFQVVEQSTAGGFNLLRQPIYPGVTAVHLIPQGAGWLHWFAEPIEVRWVQALQIFWTAVAGVIVAWLAANGLGIGAAPVAIAALLFSPFTLQTTLIPGAVCIGSLYIGACASLAVRVRQAGSVAALCAFGWVGGIAATHPALLPVIGLLGLWLLAAVWQQRRSLPWQAPVVCGVVFLAVVWPGLSTAMTLSGMWKNFAGAAQWAAVESVLFGLVRPSLTEFGLHAGAPQPFDVPVGGLLAPFAIARTSARLWGDVLFEPLATVLASIGLVWSLLAARRSTTARVLLVLFAVCLLPGLVSTYDRPSLSRLVVLPLPMALLAGLAWQGLWRWIAGRRAAQTAALVPAAVIALSGIVLFDFINPRILGSSALTITFEMLRRDDSSCHRAVVLLPSEFRGWGLDLFVENIPSCDRDVAAARAERLARPAELGPHAELPSDLSPLELIFWMPGHEEDHRIAAQICRRWPGARLYVLRDRAGLFTTFAADPRGEWQPEAVEPRACGEELETESTLAVGARQQAEELIARGDREAAISVLRQAARPLFGQFRLFELLAQLLLQEADDDARRQEALYWAERAVLASRRRDPEALRTLALANAALARDKEALSAAHEALEAAERWGSSSPTGELRSQLAPLLADDVGR
jgi:hypothetical protein